MKVWVIVYIFFINCPPVESSYRQRYMRRSQQRTYSSFPAVKEYQPPPSAARQQLVRGLQQQQQQQQQGTIKSGMA